MNPPDSPQSAQHRPLRVLLVDDHRVFTESLALALDRNPGTVCVAVAPTLSEGRAKAEACLPDVIVLDVRLPDGDGVPAVERFARVASRPRIIVLTAHPRPDLAATALKAGASAFLGKGGRLRTVIAAIVESTPARPLLDGVLHVAPETVLTQRETQVIRGICAGSSAAEISDELGISVHTVRDYTKAILAKLGARSQAEAVGKAIAQGIIEPTRV